MPILVVPPGAESALISHGVRSFQPFLENPRDPRALWLVDVPDEPAVHFCHTGGFSLYQQRHSDGRVLSGAMLPIVHDDGASSCSWDGQEYLPDGKGVFTVPSEAFDELSSHGFRVNEDISDEPDEEAAPPQRKSKEKVKRVAPEQRTDGGLPPWEADPPGTPHPDVPITSA